MPALSIDQAFVLAIQFHREGRLGEAEQIYRQILAEQPTHVNALNLLGVIASQSGQHEKAVVLIRKALALDPKHAEAHCNLGKVMQDTGHAEEAMAAYRQAIALKPDYIEAYNNLGSAFQDQEHLDEAVAAYRRAIALEPGYAKAHSNLGTALQDQGMLDEAIAECRQAIVLKGDYAEGYNNLGTALLGRGDLNEAVGAYQQAIALEPNYAEAYSNLGIALGDLGELDKAISAHNKAIALKASFAEAYNNLANVLAKKGQIDEALAAALQAIALKPNYAEAYINLGNALKDRGRLDEAIGAYRQAIGFKPGFAAAHSNILMNLNYCDVDAETIAGELRHWNEEHAEPLRKFVEPWGNDRDPERRLRIGYVSADFCAHASAYFLTPLLEHHDSRQVELFCYSQVVREDAITERLKKPFARYRKIVGLSDEQAANQIRSDRIDILVDLKLHTSDNRLLIFARKPAPVQVAWLGYPGSTGLSTLDYRLSDPYLDPPGMDESVYSEQTVRLPDSFWCYDPLRSREIPVNALPALTNGFVTFGCLNNFCKINDALLRIWANILRAVPRSRLILLATRGSQSNRVLQLFEKEGITTDRIELVPRQPRRQYMELYHRIDMCLDTFPCSGHTTSLDGFWMSVPLVTLAGRKAVDRAGVCQLMNLNLPELIGQTHEEYVQIATALANDLPRLKNLRSILRPRLEQSPLMDGARFAGNVEAAYRMMWRKWCGKVGPVK